MRFTVSPMAVAMLRERTENMAKKKVRTVGAGSIEIVTLNPPMTAKERSMVRRFRTMLGLIVGGSFEVKDKGIASMTAEVEYSNGLLMANYIQAYRDGKEE